VRFSVTALVVEFRPSARSVKVVVGVEVVHDIVGFTNFKFVRKRRNVGSPDFRVDVIAATAGFSMRLSALPVLFVSAGFPVGLSLQVWESWVSYSEVR